MWNFMIQTFGVYGAKPHPYQLTNKLLVRLDTDLHHIYKWRVFYRYPNSSKKSNAFKRFFFCSCSTLGWHVFSLFSIQLRLFVFHRSGMRCQQLKKIRRQCWMWYIEHLFLERIWSFGEIIMRMHEMGHWHINDTFSF